MTPHSRLSHHAYVVTNGTVHAFKKNNDAPMAAVDYGIFGMRSLAPDAGDEADLLEQLIWSKDGGTSNHTKTEDRTTTPRMPSEMKYKKY